MKTKFSSVAHHYMGVEMQPDLLPDERWLLTGAALEEIENFCGIAKPILRRLEDMTEEDWVHIQKSRLDVFRPESTRLLKFSPNEFHFLCKLGYDLFGLIESGEAIDHKTVNREKVGYDTES